MGVLMAQDRNPSNQRQKDQKVEACLDQSEFQASKGNNEIVRRERKIWAAGERETETQRQRQKQRIKIWAKIWCPNSNPKHNRKSTLDSGLAYST